MPYDDDRRTAVSVPRQAVQWAASSAPQARWALRVTSRMQRSWNRPFTLRSNLRFEGERLSNLVLMGMGEPFHNDENLLTARSPAHERVRDWRPAYHDQHCWPGALKFWLFCRRGTAAAGALRLACTPPPTKNGPRSCQLTGVIPVPIHTDACRYFVEKTGRRIIERALIAGKNDTVAQAQALGRCCMGRCVMSI